MHHARATVAANIGGLASQAEIQVNVWSVFTWRHGGHIGVPKQWNGGHIGVPRQSCGSWTLFLCKRSLLFHYNFSQMLARWVKTLHINVVSCPPRLKFSGVFPGESIVRFMTGNYSRHGISITTNQRLFPTFRGNGKTIKDGDSQTSSLSPIFFEESGASVHRLTRDFATDLRDTFTNIALSAICSSKRSQ